MPPKPNGKNIPGQNGSNGLGQGKRPGPKANGPPGMCGKAAGPPPSKNPAAPPGAKSKPRPDILPFDSQGSTGSIGGKASHTSRGGPPGMNGKPSGGPPGMNGKPSGGPPGMNGKSSPPNALPGKSSPPKALAGKATSPKALPCGPSIEAESEQSNVEMKSKVTDTDWSIGLLNRDVSLPAVLRPGYGTAGRRVRITTNCFMATKIPSYTVYHYHVDFVPDLVSSGAKHKVVREILDVNRQKYFKNINLAYDGRALLVATAAFPDLDLPSIDVNEKSRKFKVCLRKVGFEDLSTRSEVASQYLDVMCNEGMCSRWHTYSGKYFSGKDTYRISGNAEVWKGVSMRMLTTKIGNLINVDLAFVAFHSATPILDSIEEAMQSGRGGGGQKVVDFAKFKPTARFSEEMGRALKGLKVIGNHLAFKSKFRVLGITSAPASHESFELDGRNITIADYFQRKYNIRLRYPHLPCLVCENSRMNDIKFPLEVCVISGNQRITKMSETQTADMLKITATPPKQRFRNICESVSTYGILRNPSLDSFGFKFEPNLVQCESRVLEPPYLRYGDVEVAPNKGSWNLRGVKATQGASVSNWVVVNTGSPNCWNGIEQAVATLIQISASYGLTMSRKYLTRDAKANEVAEAVWQTKCRFALVFINSTSDHPIIKRDCETTVGGTSNMKYGVITQCIKLENLSKAKTPAFAANVALKINCKLGGKNGVLHSDFKTIVSQMPTIVFGADVTHPRGGDDSPSIAACVASMGLDMATYRAIARCQAARTEIMTDIEEMVADHLLKFRELTGHWPRRIIFYRDGIGQGQVKLVCKNEISAIRRACEQIHDYKPEITFISVQKRHNMRFMVGENNVSPGTIVEDVCRAEDFDFYLVAHHALQGTARPAHYKVILNESQLSADTIQKLTYYMSHLYARSTKAVSVVPAVYYAHLTAFRARSYNGRNLFQEIRQSMYFI